MYVYIYIYIYIISWPQPGTPPAGWGGCACDGLSAPGRSPKRELEHRIPRLDSPVNSRRFPEISVRQNNVGLGIRGKPFAPVDFYRKLEPVPRTQVLSHHRGPELQLFRRAGPHPQAHPRRAPGGRPLAGRGWDVSRGDGCGTISMSLVFSCFRYFRSISCHLYAFFV